MPKQVCMGAMLKCSFGTAPTPLKVLPTNKVITTTPDANIMDNKPMLNITPFVLCRSLANPVVASATTAAAGVLTPMPCVPFTLAPWVKGEPSVLLANMPTLNDSSKLFCNWGGVIEVSSPGQATVDV